MDADVIMEAHFPETAQFGFLTGSAQFGFFTGSAQWLDFGPIIIVVYTMVNNF